MESASVSRYNVYKVVFTLMVLVCVLWTLLSYQFLSTTVHNGDRLLMLPFPDLFRLDGNLTVPERACTWSQANGLTPCVYRRGKQTLAWNGTRVHMAVVACGDRSSEAMVLLKSAVALTTRAFIVFYIFADIKQHSFFVDQFRAWPEAVLESVEFRLYPDTYPSHLEHWRHQFGPCASQRLLFHSLLMEVEAVVYVDADAVLLSPLDKVWRYFSRFNSTQMLALVAEHEDAAVSWYRKNSRIPYYLPFGLNSGVVLMNLTRLRQVEWLTSLIHYHHQYKHTIVFFDQDLINLYCRFHPERFYLLDCAMNYRLDHCDFRDSIPGSVCKPAEDSGVSVLHGNRRSFKEVDSFQAVYRAFKKYKLGSNLLRDFLLPLREELMDIRRKKAYAEHASCNRFPEIFLKNIIS